MPPAKRAPAKAAAPKPAAPAATAPAATSPEDKPRGAAAKLAMIQGSVQRIEKTGRHTGQNYEYIQEHKVFEAIRSLTRQLKCSVVVSCADVVRVDTGLPYYKGIGNLVTLTGTVVFTDSEAPLFVDGQPNPDRVITASYVGQGMDGQDRAAGKAQTYLTKYALQKFFRIPTEDIDDADARDIEAEGHAAVVTGSAPAPAAPPAQAAQDPAATGTATGVETGEVVNPDTAKQLVTVLTDFVKAGQLDGNKVKAKLGTYRTDQVGNLTVVQFDEFRTWLNAQVAAAGG